MSVGNHATWKSHNFRNNAVGKPKEDGTPRRTRYERLLEEVIKKGQKTKVLLLSATPVNNQIADLRNQISFIAGGDVARDASGEYDGAFKEKLGIPSIKDTTRKAQAKFTNWTKKPTNERKARDLIHELGSDFFKLLGGLSIARSRSQIKRYYAKEMERLGGFPNREKPTAEYPRIDLLDAFISFEELDQKISELKLSLYHPSTKLKKNLPPEDFEIGGKHKINLAHLNLPEWLLAVRQDRAQLQNLLDHSRPVVPARDAKLARVKELITAKVTNPAENKDGKPVRKILLFTAFADTARYLHENLAKWSQDSLGIHTALVCGGGQYKVSLGKVDLEHTLTNFSPLSKQRDRQPDLPQDQEIDLLIATDCISEGQNLQDCDLLINYDIHWNPVRIIQRFGRIDRIGSRNKSVSLVNFWPTKDLDAYLNVKNRVEDRMALVDLTASGEDNLLASDQIEDLIKADLHYRNKQLKDLQKGVVDFDEEDPEGISLADFSLTDFRLDLLRFLENNRELLETAELGLFAVVPPDPSIPVSQPGVIFCLRQRDNKRPTEVNPLAPYYLVYVLDDGNVRLTFMQPKQALDLFRALAAGHASAFSYLCDSFDARNANGTDMSHETKLLESAMESIKRTFARRATTSLLSGRDGLLPMASETPTSSDDMELVTWLVVMENKP